MTQEGAKMSVGHQHGKRGQGAGKARAWRGWRGCASALKNLVRRPLTTTRSMTRLRFVAKSGGGGGRKRGAKTRKVRRGVGAVGVVVWGVAIGAHVIIIGTTMSGKRMMLNSESAVNALAAVSLLPRPAYL